MKSRERIYGIGPGLTYEVAIRGSEGQVIDRYVGIVTALKRHRRSYTVETIEEADKDRVRRQQYSLETMMSGGTPLLEITPDLPVPAEFVGIRRVVTLSRVISKLRG